jgi:hypothetical protein
MRCVTTIRLQKFSKARSFGGGHVVGMAMQRVLCNRFHSGSRGTLPEALTSNVRSFRKLAVRGATGQP